MNILVAEDDEVLRRALRLMLTRWGWEVIVAEDGLAALRLLQQADAPPVALVDWTMPGLTGPELCRRLRAESSLPLPYILMLTGRGNEALSEALLAGANDFVLKPFNNSQLRACLDVARVHVLAHQELRR